MKKEIELPADAARQQPNTTNEASAENTGMDRRKFISLAATTALGFSIVPRHVLGGKGFVPPSDKITLAYIGLGTQGLKEMLPLLAVPEIQVVAVCDPNKEARGYRDWSLNGLRNEVRKAINNPAWEPRGDNTIPVALIMEKRSWRLTTLRSAWTRLTRAAGPMKMQGTARERKRS
jgi:hypothetical protein